MTRSPLPENWQELIAGYALGNLGPEEAEELKRVLEANPDLAAEVKCYQEVLALMPYTLPEQEPPPRLRSAILEAASGETGSPFGAELPSRMRGGRNRVWWQMGGAVAALLILGLAIDNFRLRQTVQTEQEILTLLQQPKAITYALAGTGATANASGSLILDPDHQKVGVLVKNLPELPAGQAYRLWAVAKGQPKPAYCGQFNSDPRHNATTTWSLSEASCSTAVSQVMITAESATDPPIARGPLVMKSTL